MAVYTEVAEDSLQAFLANYDLGELLAYKGIAEGVENSNFLLHTQTGYYILTLYEKRVYPGDLPFFLGLMEHLSERGITCPTPVHAQSGSMLGQLSGRPAAIVTFLDGMWLRKPRPHHCAELGTQLARLHLAGEGFALSRKNSLSVEDWPELFNSCRGVADTVTAGLAELIDQELATIHTHWPTDLPSGVIHGDLFPDNVFFLRDQLTGLIDFYFACNDWYAYDVAICLNAWCFEPDLSFNVTKARALLKGYTSQRRFTAAEFDALPLLARGSALRFLLTRLTDWLTIPDNALVTPKDPMEYVRKLRFHRSVTSTGAYGLDE
jgi:homoserine kinase type II